MRKIFQLPNITFPIEPALNAFLRSLRDAIDSGGRHIESKEILDGNWITDVSLPATTNTTVDHKLGRQPQGWLTTDRDAAATVHRVDWDERHLTLYSSAAVTIDLWVF